MVLKEWVITRKLTLFHFHGLTLTRADIARCAWTEILFGAMSYKGISHSDLILQVGAVAEL